jgi:hypothetical protein
MTSRLVELDAIKAEISSLESAREAAVTSKEELVEGYIKLHGESTCLKSALETIPQLTADVEKWKAQSGEAERELKRCKRDREEDGSRIKALEGSVRGLVSERDRLTSDKTTLEASKAAETTSREAAEALAMEKVEEVDRLQASLEHARANAATATEPLDTEVKSLKAENAKLIEQSENLARANRTLEQELEKLRSGQASAFRSSIAPSATAGAIGAQAPAAVSKSRGDLGRPKTPPSKSLSIPMRTEPPIWKDPFHSWLPGRPGRPKSEPRCSGRSLGAGMTRSRRSPRSGSLSVSFNRRGTIWAAAWATVRSPLTVLKLTLRSRRS